jgi:rRNA maturation endonuclease Nob1
MTRSTFWANLTPAQQNRLSRYQCTGCKQTLRLSLTKGACTCGDQIERATACLKASAYPHINTVPEAAHASA